MVTFKLIIFTFLFNSFICFSCLMFVHGIEQFSRNYATTSVAKEQKIKVIFPFRRNLIYRFDIGLVDAILIWRLPSKYHWWNCHFQDDRPELYGKAVQINFILIFYTCLCLDLSNVFNLSSSLNNWTVLCAPLEDAKWVSQFHISYNCIYVYVCISENMYAYQYA